MKTRLEQGLSALHLSPTPSGTLERYCSLLLEQNQMMNLTAITDPDQVVDLHMLDSAALLTVDDFSGKKVAWLPALMGKGSTLCQKCEEFMENKNSCKENFEMAKTELQDMEAIADFFSNPMIKS